jgi:hypothetical protein
MPDHFCVSRQTAEEFMRLFVNRLAYGIQTVKPDGSAPYKKQVRPLDLGALRMHLNGEITINLFAINPQTQRCKWVAIDADFTGSLDALFHLRWELKQDGVEAALEQSRRGGHLWIFGEQPLLASQCRIYIYNLALRLGVPVKGGGLQEGIEVFPRQDQIRDGGYGNAIRGPLGVHRKTNLRYWFYEADLNPEAQLAYLQGLKKLSAVDLETLTQGMTLPQAYRSPEPVPFIPSNPAIGGRDFRILDYVRTTGKQDSRNWKAQCPSCAQAGRDRSRDNLGIKIADPRFYVCRAGCTKEEIRAALGQPIRKSAIA